MKKTAGALLYRQTVAGLEVLLVHPSGNYNRHASWSIPKGELEEDEDMETAARRETLEETGLTSGHLIPLGSVKYTKSRKQVFCFAGPTPLGAAPSCASWEIDRCAFVSIMEAKRLIHPDQAVFLDRLEKLLKLP